MGTGSGKGLNFGSTRGSRVAIDSEDIEDIEIGRSVGAAALNYKIKDKATNKTYTFVPGTEITNIEIFAGKGAKSKLRPEVTKGLVKDFGGKEKNWQHVKGIGFIDMGNGSQKAEVHWFQEKSVGKRQFVIKRWL